MPAEYYALVAGEWLRHDVQELTPARQAEVAQVAAECRSGGRLASSTELLLSSLLPRPARVQQSDVTLRELLERKWF